ncbi:Transmembrane protein 120-like protein [Picochlorum sp. SENEW3]|nr:Transmembrane protein 120-like protein [Picochlorum sp. SENEW3]WPT14842.1 Transmembrane protein 120-like protein [Picochlorum sp. SENEW3]
MQKKNLHKFTMDEDTISAATVLEESERLLHKTREFSGRVARFGNKLSSEMEILSDDANQLYKEVERAFAHQEQIKIGLESRDSASSEEMRKTQDSAVALESALSIFNGYGPGGDLRKYVSKFSKRPLLLDWFHGPSTQVAVHRKDQSTKLKEEYRTFRSNCAVIMFVFAAVLQLGVSRSEKMRLQNEQLTMLPVVMAGVQLFLCWLLFFYTATAMRESVLKVNGSRIRPWWIQHHYWSMATCVLMLSLPIDSPAVVRACRQFLWWAMLQGVVMILQNRYQRGRMYTRIALGKSSATDVIGGESSGSFGQLHVLYPVLFWMQILQFYIGIGMFWSSKWSWQSLEGFLDPEHPGSDLWGSRGVALAGLMMMYMALKNFQNTIATIVGKRKKVSRHPKKEEKRF